MKESKALPYIPPIISAKDVTIFKKVGYGKRMGFGDRIALIIVDVNKGFVDERYDISCGKSGRQVVKHIQILLKKARKKKLPIFFSRNYPWFGAEAGRWPDKGTGKAKNSPLHKQEAHVIIPEISPKSGEIIITKSKPSVFFGTQFISLLTFFSIDTLIVTGLVTSGCVRATVVDAFSYNYRVIVPIECVGDRGEVSHQVSLFDMDMKYADVIPLSDVICHIDSIKG